MTKIAGVVAPDCPRHVSSRNVTGVTTPINLFLDTIRDSLQAKVITKEVSVNQVFDFSYVPPR